MNKFVLIVLLVVCFVSVQGFVKRDAPADDNNETYKNLQQKITELTKSLGEQIQKTLDPEAIKKGFNELVDQVHKTYDDLKPKEQKPAA